MMSKEEFLKIQTCVLKVNIHCDGCKHKVKKTLQQIDGVYTTNVDSEQGKVTVSGNVDPDTLIKKLSKKGKHAEIWGAPKSNPNLNQMKNLQLDNGKGGNNKRKGQGQNPGPTQKVGAKGGQQGPTPTQIQQFQQQLKDMKLHQMKNLKMPFAKNQNGKGVKFNIPGPEELSDDDFDEDDDDLDDEYDYDDEFDDDMDDVPLPPNKMKPMVINGNGGGGMMMKGGQLPQMKVAPGGGIGDVNGKKGNIPVQMGCGGDGANGGKKGGGGNQNQGGGGNQSQGGGGPAKNGGGKNGGGPPSDGKNGGGGGSAAAGNQNKNGNNGNGGGKKGSGGMNDGFPIMPNIMGMPGVGGGVAGGSHGANLDQMGNMSMGNIPAVQGLPAAATGGSGGGYFQGAGPEIMAGNPHYQQQMAAMMMMNQQRANGNEGFHPMMYARQPPAVNYMPPYQPYPPPPHDPYSGYVSDENTSGCNVM